MVLLFLLSWMWAGPALWFGLSAAALAFFQLASRAARKIAFVSAIACALLAAWPMTPMIQTIYSPYQVIEKASQPNGLMSLLVSGSYYQKVFDLSPSNANRETGALRPGGGLLRTAVPDRQVGGPGCHRRRGQRQ